MKYNHRNFSTPMIMASGLVITVSGIMMFFHLEKDLVKLMHEWIGLVMAVGVLLHIQFHWRAFKRYLTKKSGIAVIIGILLASSAIALTAPDKKAQPTKQLVEHYSDKSLEQIAAFENRTIEQLLVDLEIAHYSVSSVELSLNDIAHENHASPFEVIDAVINPDY